MWSAAYRIVQCRDADRMQVLENGVPDKGEILTKLTDHWYSVLSQRLPQLKHHFISMDLPSLVSNPHDVALLQNRSMVVRKLKVFPIESIVRGYITGSAWSEYKSKGTVNGMEMPKGLVESQKLETPLWTPSTKAEMGEKDENISPEHGLFHLSRGIPTLTRQAAQIVGADYAQMIASLSLEVYSAAQDYAAERGIIIADTKFEFGLDESTSPPSVVLIDEVLTPDSSRFWDAKNYEPGRPQGSLDKQYLRDWLTHNGLKGKDDVAMPPDVVDKTREGYIEAYERLSGRKWSALRVLLVGNGGREHALAWKLSQSPHVNHIFVCPGNGGTNALPKTTNVSGISASSFPDLVSFSLEKKIDVLVPGPEQPLVDGIVDYFHTYAEHIRCFGPTRKAAHMEGSKTFSKDFMARWNIPTARYHSFNDYEAARQHIDSVTYDIVLKADGLAAGKGVIIPANKQEAREALKSIMVDKAFGASGQEIVIEEFLQGDEISILSFCDGSVIKSLPPAQDHKRIFDGDKGPNTGGMGTYAPAPSGIVDDATLLEIEEKVLKPTMRGMKEEGILSTPHVMAL
jgi:phosphoribosylaminoimidazole-succinocarboxamide synthase